MMTEKGNSETALVIGTDRDLTIDHDHQLRAYASQVMRHELTEEYEYTELAIDVYDPQPVEGQPGVHDLYVQGHGESSDGCFETIEWTIRLGFNAQGEVIQIDFEE